MAGSQQALVLAVEAIPSLQVALCSTAEAGAQFLLSRRPSQLCCLLAKFFTSQHSDLTLGLHLPVC